MKDQCCSLTSNSREILHVDMSREQPAKPDNELIHSSNGTTLPDGVIIQATDIMVPRPTTYTFEAQKTPLTISFCLEGRADIAVGVCGKPKRSIVHSPPLCTMTHLPRAEGTWTPTYGRCRILNLTMPAYQTFSVWREFKGGLPPELAPLARGEAPLDFFLSVPVTPDIQSAVRNLAACPIQGPGQELYLQCKAREILILMIAHLCRLNSLSEKAIPLTDADLQGIQEARRLLEENMEDPPTLVQLARMAGINEFKLKKGFRQIFGITPFNHLREIRLDAARTHLESGKMNVCEACVAVGYSNLGNFIGLFKKKFGLTPGDLLRSALRTRHMAN